MRKIYLTLTGLLLVGLLSNVHCQIDKGFSLNLETGVPMANFGANAAETGDYKYGTLIGGQIGSRWYISPLDKFGAGIMLNWFDFVMASKSGTEFGVSWSRLTIDMAFIELGPIASIGLTDNIAIDGYYNIRPTLLISGGTGTMLGVTQDYGSLGFGLSHAIGAAFRYRILNVGLEVVSGGINSAQTIDGSTSNLGKAIIYTNSVRVLLGLKF